MSSIKANRWAWVVSVLAMTGAGLVLSFMLVFATQNGERYERHFEWLFVANIAIASLLALVIVLALARLAIRLRKRKFGSRLLLKLAGIFAGVGAIPGPLTSTVSYQFDSRSIETWFDVRVEGALEAGLSLGRGTIDTLAVDLGNKTRLAAERLGGPLDKGLEVTTQPGVLDLERVREQLGAQSVALITEVGQVQTGAGSDPLTLMSAERVPLSWRQDARNKGVVSLVEGLEDNSATGEPRIVALAWMPDRSFSLQSKGHYLLVTQKLRADLVKNALDVQNAYREYRPPPPGREGLRRMYHRPPTPALNLHRRPGGDPGGDRLRGLLDDPARLRAPDTAPMHVAPDCVYTLPSTHGRPRSVRRRHAPERAGLGRRALPAHRNGPRREAVRADPRRRRLDRRDVGRGRTAARRRPARPGRPLQAELRPAPGDARRPQPGPRRHRDPDGR